MFVQAYLNTADHIIKSYRGDEPFGSFIKNFFAHHKKFGSRDRRHIADLCYNFFRLGNALLKLGAKDRVLIGSFLCKEESKIINRLLPDWSEYSGRSLDDRICFISTVHDFRVEDIFGFRDHLSDNIDLRQFSRSFLTQPDTHLRIRPGRKEQVIRKLEEANIPYRELAHQSLALPPATKLKDILLIDEEVVIQDFSSQRVIEPLVSHASTNVRWSNAWDCCAASGGKSILLHDHFPHIFITATDVRSSIIQNLRSRFKLAGIDRYKAAVADLTGEEFSLGQHFELVICDVPCTGSGTWGRTPEQLYLFDERKISHYTGLQKKIVGNAVKSLANGGILLYATCSVFKEENEVMVDYMKEQHGLKFISQQYLTGYENRGDTLFVALFISEL